MRFISKLPYSRYEEYEQRHPLGRFMQSHAQLEMYGLSQKVGCLGVADDDNRIIAGATYHVEHARIGDIYSIYGGPLLNYDDQTLVDFLFTNMERLFKKKGGVALRFTPTLDMEKIDDNGRVVEEMNGTIIDNFQKMGYRWVKQEPITDNRIPLVGLGYEYRKDLSSINSVDELRATYDKRARNDIKRAERFGVYVKKLSYDELAGFKAHTAETAKLRNFQDKPLRYYQQAYKKFKDNIIFLEVRLNLNKLISSYTKQLSSTKKEIRGIEERLQENNSKKLKTRYKQCQQKVQSISAAIERAKNELKIAKDGIVVLSGGMFLIQPQELSYMFSFTDKRFSNYYGQHYLMDYVMQEALKRNIPTYNFYMVTGLFDGSDGVLKFKQLFNGTTYRTLGWFEKPLQPIKYYADRLVKKITGHANDVR